MSIDLNSINSSDFTGLYKIVTLLRSPDGCPWDRKQTAVTLKSDLIEEVYECIDAIDSGDSSHIKEELGDVFLILSMLIRIYEEQNNFNCDDVFSDICEKLIRRHPHVFGDEKIIDSEAVVKRWDEIKKEVEGRGNNEFYLATVPKSLPPLERSYQLQKKASKVGFDWQEIHQVFEKLREEIDELEETMTKVESQDRKTEELGDTLFSLINVSRFLKIDPGLALHVANRKFINRFLYIERAMKAENKELSAENFEAMDRLWNKARENNIK